MSKLNRILRPKSIATVGGIHAQRVVEQCLKMGFTGEIWPVHPHKLEVAGLRAYPNVESLPGSPDAAFIGVNRTETVSVVAALKKLNAGGAVCYASGFEESGKVGRDLQAELVDAAQDMPIIGPNCYGMINYAEGALLWPDQQGGRRLEQAQTGVAIITQSSNIAINFSMQRRGLPLAFLGTVGNQAQTGISDIALEMLQDPRVTVLGLHIEGFDSPQAMERLALESRRLKKPVVVFKVGKSKYAQMATLSHTASLSGQHSASCAFLSRNGFGQAHSIEEFLESLKLLHCGGPLYGYRLSSMSCSGGEASIIADSSEGKRVSFPSLTDAQVDTLQNALGPMVAVSNPLDYHTYCWGKPEEMKEVYGAMVGCGFDMNFLVLDFPALDCCEDSEWLQAVRTFRSALEEKQARGAVLVSMGENISGDYAQFYTTHGLCVLIGFETALRSCEIAADIGRAWVGEPCEPVLVSRLKGSLDSARAGVREGSNPATNDLEDNRDRRTLSEPEAKALLKQHGIPIPLGKEAKCASEVANVAMKIGFPVVLKATGIAHKTEADAVRLNLVDEASVLAAAHDLFRISDVLYVEKMVDSRVAEIIVGVTRDEQFGLQMTLGSGGILVEILKDATTLLLPTNREEITNALLTLQSAPLFHGYRGKPKADLEGAIEAIMGVQSFALSRGDDLLELDINPLILGAQDSGVFAADALIVLLQEK